MWPTVTPCGGCNKDFHMKPIDASYNMLYSKIWLMKTRVKLGGYAGSCNCYNKNTKT
jgi:hypothetical protein